MVVLLQAVGGTEMGGLGASELLKLGPAGLLLVALFVMLRIIIGFQKEMNAEAAKTRTAHEALQTSMVDSLKAVTSMQQATATSLQAVAAELRGIVIEARSLVNEVKAIKSGSGKD
jgi:hypothetical protein